MRKMILQEKKRIDGRGLKEIRPIDVEQSILPRTHGSSLFTRGETQALAVCTLGGENTAQRFEDLHGENSQKFYLQYFFPPFSVGEVGRMGSPGRREIGHGKLAERALAAILPKHEDFPYVIRLESNITESNGSSSMASVCGGCLSMMDAGVPIKRPVAGIAMGLILEGDQHAILSDILGAEDALGDMDFKVTGDDRGITAFQMDIKIEGINHKIMREALMQAKEGRSHILRKMLEVCPESKTEMSIYAPRIETMLIKPSKIGIVIGPGGKQIRAIIEETGVQIDIDDSGQVSIASTNPDAMARAKEIIHNLTAEVEIGQVYKGRISSIKDFGYFVELFGKEGLCHISEISTKRIQNIADAPFKIGDMIEVKVLDVNDRGQIKLSHRAVLEQQAVVR
jgi:polyribonucleotide nucleotidyltransferase